MICDDVRPCSRCIKRNISHLCHDEPVSRRQKKKIEERQEIKAEETKPPTLTETPPLRLKNSDSSILQNTVEIHSVPLHLQQQLNYSSLNNKQPIPSIIEQPHSQNHSQQHQNQNQNQSQNQHLQEHESTIPAPDQSAIASMAYNQQPVFFSEHAGSEFSSLNEFLSMLDDPELNLQTGNSGGNSNNNSAMHSGLNSTSGSTFFNSLNSMGTGNGSGNGALSTSHSLTNLSLNNLSGLNLSGLNTPALLNGAAFPPLTPSQIPQQHVLPQQHQQQQQQQQNQHSTESTFNNKPPGQYVHNDTAERHVSDSARDKFFLTAADPSTEISPEERLKQVINAKLEAGLLQPYNYAKGYARLQSYMDNYMNYSSKQRILKPLSIFRPAFRAIARTLKDVDLILVEESFERMLLDYDRVFTSMAIPACLWRRTGEIYRGNKEFASLVEVSTDDLRDGKLAIYELMSEESAVNFWEKYGAIAFDKGQKAVLTSCNLRTRDGRKRKTCCFSFTIRRDRYNIPSCIVGNFIPINP